MDLGLKDKVVLVTGSSRGIGKAVAAAFAREGCRVVMNARNASELAAAAAEVGKAGGVVLPLAADVTEAQGVHLLVDKTVARFGTVHVLVNNVGGVGRVARFDALSDGDWAKAIELNLMSTVRTTRAVLPLMRQQKWGRIVNVATENEAQPDPDFPHYSALKATVVNLTKSLAMSYADDGILANAVSPAFIRTPLIEGMLNDRADREGIAASEAESRFLREKRPFLVLRRAGAPEEVAHVVLFLASEAASFVTGANYRVDGGSVGSI